MNFPLFIDLKDKKVLIVGAGAIAARRATVLVEFGAKVTVMAPEDQSTSLHSAGAAVPTNRWTTSFSHPAKSLGRNPIF